MPNPKSCTHIKVTGVRCESPALRGEQFCYFHQNAYRGVRRPAHSRLHPVALIESEEAIQASLMEVINGLIRNTLDVKRAELIIRALNIAVRNARRVKFDSEVNAKVKEVPQYAEPESDTVETAAHVGTGAACPERSRRARPASKASAAVTTADPFDDFLPAVAAVPYKPVDPRDPHFLERSEEGGRVLAREAAERRAAEARATQAVVTASGSAHVGTAAPGCPGRAPTAADTVTNAGVKVHPRCSKAENLTVDPPKRKPPLGVKAEARTNAVPKARKNAAQRASAG